MGSHLGGCDWLPALGLNMIKSVIGLAFILCGCGWTHPRFAVGDLLATDAQTSRETNPPTRETGTVPHADGSVTHVYTQDIRYGSVTPSYHWFVDEKDGLITSVVNPRQSK